MHRYSWYLAATVWALWILGLAVIWDVGRLSDIWPIAPTMLFGSFIAGSTSAGGGAVAFPVMTLVFGVQPTVARDFSLMIQSVGMGAAAIGIVLMKIRVEWKAVALANLGGMFGLLIGFQIAATWPAAFTKMFFVSLWVAIAFALFLINRKGREVTRQLGQYTPRIMVSLVAMGVVGGTVSGLTGSGLDILTFAMLTMLYRLCETIATPTSVVIMACNSIIGVCLRSIDGGFSEQAIAYWWGAVPVVVVGAPLGAWYIKNKSRHFITNLLYVSIAAQFIGAIFIVPQTVQTAVLSCAVIAIGVTAFMLMSRCTNKEGGSVTVVQAEPPA